MGRKLSRVVAGNLRCRLCRFKAKLSDSGLGHRKTISLALYKAQQRPGPALKPITHAPHINFVARVAGVDGPHIRCGRLISVRYHSPHDLAPLIANSAGCFARDTLGGRGNGGPIRTDDLQVKAGPVFPNANAAVLAGFVCQSAPENLRPAASSGARAPEYQKDDLYAPSLSARRRKR
jgi:hypothetical protein